MDSYEDLSGNELDEEFELKSSSFQRTAKLIRKDSMMETNLDSSGIMKMTYWF